jgi:hypothetical protein
MNQEPGTGDRDGTRTRDENKKRIRNEDKRDGMRDKGHEVRDKI